MKWQAKDLAQAEGELAAARTRLAGSAHAADLRQLVTHWDANPEHACHCVEDMRGLVAILEHDQTQAVLGAHWERADVYRAIDEERAHQAGKYGAGRSLSLPGFLLVIELELAEAKLAVVKGGEGRNSAMAEVLQIAATAVAALEKYGVMGCPVATDDFVRREGIGEEGTGRDG